MESILQRRRGRQELSFRNKLVVVGGGGELQNVIVALIGRKGSGKSTLSREILRRGDREFIFDTMGEHTWVPNPQPDLAEAEVFIFSAGMGEGSWIASYVPEGDELESEFSQICTAVYEAGNMTLVVEELPMMSQPNFVPARFNRIVRLGRHRCINVVYTGQRMSECPRRVTAATDVFILFSHTEPRDLDAIAERCGPEVAELVAKLEEHEFLVWDVKSRQILLVDSAWYDSVLKPGSRYTPAIGGRFGRSALMESSDGGR